MSDKVIISKSKLTTLADYIRAKSKTSGLLTLDSMASTINELNTGSAIEVEELPQGGWKGTAVPNSGNVTDVYFNTSITFSEYNNILSNITFTDSSVLGQSGFSFYAVMAYINGSSPYVLGFIKYSEDNIHLGLIDFSTMFTVQNFFVSEWYEFDNPYPINSEVLPTLSGLPIGSENDKLSNLISATPFEQLEEPVEGSIYKVISTGKLYIYKDGQYVELTEGGSGGGSSEEKSWSDVTENKLLDCEYYYIASNRVDCYYSYNSSSKAGIYHKNLETGEITKIYTSGYSWSKFGEDSKGNIFISSSNKSVYGIIHINGKTVKQIYNNGVEWILYEGSNGSIYFYSDEYNGTKRPVLYFNGTSCIEVEGTNFTGNGIYKNLTHFFEDKEQNIFVTYYSYISSSVHIPLIYLNGSTATQVTNIGEGATLLQDSKGNEYVSCYFVLLKKEGLNFTEIYNTSGTTKHTNIFETRNGILYFYAIDSRVYYCENDNVIQIDNTKYFDTFFEDSKGNVYAGYSRQTGNLIHLNGSVVTVLNTSCKINKFYENKKGQVYAMMEDNYSYCFYLNGTTATKYSLDSSYNIKNFIEIGEYTYITRTEQPVENDDIYRVDGATITTYKYII